jgi:hypothetical protein
MRTWRVVGPLLLVPIVSAGGPACELFGRPQIMDECGRVLQESRFLKCVEVVPAMEPCAQGITKRPVTSGACH